MDEQIDNIPVSSTNTNNSLSQLMLEDLQKTAPWINFISIVGFILSGFMIIAAIFILVASIAGRNAGMGIGMFIVYLILAIVMIYPNIYLNNYARYLKEFTFYNNPDSLESAFLMQRKFWKYMGVLTIIYIAFILIAIIGGVFGSIFSTRGF
jgi:hypothetical protein